MRLRAATRALRRGRRPVVLGSLGSTRPLSSQFGYDRGTPVDRWYIERFLDAHRSDITGRVLEVKDSGYTDRFGHDVSEASVLDIDASNERATHVADLAAADNLAGEAFDCFLLSQTLQFVFDLDAALGHARRLLSPGGVALITVPTVSPVCDPPLTDYWRFTPGALSRLLEGRFGGGEVTVEAHGNVLAQIAFLAGLAAEELTEDELADDDTAFPLVVCARAARPG